MTTYDLRNARGAVGLGLCILVACSGTADGPVVAEALSAAEEDAGARDAPEEDPALEHTRGFIEEGRRVFRHDTFGSEAFWGGALELHRAVAGQSLGGDGPGLTPQRALELGLKVDEEALPSSLRDDLTAGRVDLEDPAVTLALLELDAVVGIKGFFEGDGEDAGDSAAAQLTSVGIQCALCHSTVDDSLAPGVGRRLDGWPNRDLDVGAVIALAPDLQPLADLLGADQDTVRSVLQSWGPGRYDAYLVVDGQAFQPDGRSAATMLPAAFGLAGVNLATYTGAGSVTYWNAYVATTQMHGMGVFYDPRLEDEERAPVAAEAGLGNTRDTPDLLTAKLPALHFYQLSLPAPEPTAGSFDVDAADRGQQLFNGKADCARCHVPPLYTEPGWNLHSPEEIGIDAFQASRSPTGRYRTTPLSGLFTRLEGGLYHDGRFETLDEVIRHYDELFELQLSEQEHDELREFLLSL